MGGQSNSQAGTCTTLVGLPRKFAERLRRLRHVADLSQQELADLSSVGRVTIARIEAAAQSPKLDTIQKLASAMGYPIQALMMDGWADYTE